MERIMHNLDHIIKEVRETGRREDSWVVLRNAHFVDGTQQEAAYEMLDWAKENGLRVLSEDTNENGIPDRKLIFLPI